MKQFYKIIFLLVLINSGANLNASNKNIDLTLGKPLKVSIPNLGNSNLILPTATITGTTTICQGGSEPQITFTGSGGTAPYTFTYHINNGSPLTAVTTGTNSSVTVAVNTSITGTFTYNLDSVHDANTPTTEQPSSGSATVNISLPPVVDFTFTNDDSCMGTVIQFSSNVTAGSYTYLWNFGDGTSSTQQNPNHSFVSLGCATATFNVSLTITGA
jgi:PKD repeat protein